MLFKWKVLTFSFKLLNKLPLIIRKLSERIFLAIFKKSCLIYLIYSLLNTANYWLPKRGNFGINLKNVQQLVPVSDQGLTILQSFWSLENYLREAPCLAFQKWQDRTIFLLLSYINFRSLIGKHKESFT